MLFNSLQFICFFPIVICLCFLIPHRARWALLLAASYFYYMSYVPTYILLVMVSTLVTYVTGNGIAETNRQALKRVYLGLSLVINFGMLALFKYYSFISDNLLAVLQSFDIGGSSLPAFNFVLPIGISFHTFQAVSYSLDIYLHKVRPEKHLGIFAVYSCFFPQLVAGPIERPAHLLPQFHTRHDFDYDRVTCGLKFIVWGFFLKLVVADNLAVYVNPIYNNPRSYTGVSLILATYFFAFQIFSDFAGYTDIAIGTAKIMGFDLMENFNKPYLSKSIAEFWRRWHISLSTWFRDYLYIPLGGNKVSLPRWCINLIVVFVLCGIWHGANWTFIVWGGLHGVYMIASILTRRPRKILTGMVGIDPEGWFLKGLRIFTTFNLVCVGWIFFRAKDLRDGCYIVTHLFSNLAAGFAGSENLPRLFFYFALILFLLVAEIRKEGGNAPDIAMERNLPLCPAGYGALIVAIWFLGQFEGADFIYFKF